MSTAYYRLPVSSTNASSTFQTTLDGVTYTFSFCWNERAGAWYMGVGDADEVPILSGVRVSANTVIGANQTNPALWPGLLVVNDTSKQNLDPGLTDLGTRVELQYWPGV